MNGSYAVFLTPQALEELNGITDLWLKVGDKGPYIICTAANTDGGFTQLEIDDEAIAGHMHLKIPHHYIRAILFGESLSSIGVIQENEK